MKNGFASHVNGHTHCNGLNGSTNTGRLYSKTVITTLPWHRVSYKALFALVIIVPALFLNVINLAWWFYPLMFIICFLPIFIAFVMTFNWYDTLQGNNTAEITKFINFHDTLLANKYTKQRLPFETLYEAYADEKLDFKGDVLECLKQREQFSTFRFTLNHLKIFCLNFIPEMLCHSRVQDMDQVRDHYDRGDDFYEAFLGPMMVYTSGILKERSETLEELQLNKLQSVCDKVLMKEGDKHLDIGCGWGTLVNYAAEHRGATSTGVSISKNQVEWARNVTTKRALEDKANFLCIDYRDIPNDERYDKITCLEMSEHVGILKYQSFLCQVRDLMTDDGIFFLQVAGLRRAWQWEDFVWGLFMDKYVFPGADASCPLSFVVQQLEAAGFEVANVETVGIHYSYTIHRWYQNWVKPETKEVICAKYGVRLYRIWEIFLAWSTIIASQGNSTCFQVVCHKNLNDIERSRYFPIKEQPK